MIIEDGRGKGKSAGVDLNQHILIAGPAWSRQSFESQVKGRAFQVIGEHTVAGAATIPVLFMQNDNPELELLVTFMRLQVLGITPAAGEFFEIGFGNTYTSGGTAVTPVNVNTGSSKPPNVTAYGNNPTLGGTFTQIDKWRPLAANDEQTFSKEGSVVIAPQRSLTIRYTALAAAGTLYARTSFYLTEPHENI